MPNRNGHVIASGIIAVDHWHTSYRAQHFFLTNCHPDHVGDRIQHWRRAPIRTGEMNAKLLNVMYGVPKERILVLPIGETVSLGDKSDIGGVFQVTALGACHCPGSLMLLFQGSFGSILYTGDFRYCSDVMLQNQALRFAIDNIGINELYLDNTYCSARCVFPERDTLLPQIIDYVKHWQRSEHVYIGMRNLGKEEFLVALAKALNEKIHVDEWRRSVLELIVPDCFSLFTSDENQSRIHVVPFTQLDQYYNRGDCLCLHLTAHFTDWPGKTPFRRGEVQVFPYSDHCNFAELCRFVECIRPRRVFPIVRNWSGRWTSKRSLSSREDMSVFRTFLASSQLDTNVVLESPPQCHTVVKDSNQQLYTTPLETSPAHGSQCPDDSSSLSITTVSSSSLTRMQCETQHSRNVCTKYRRRRYRKRKSATKTDVVRSDGSTDTSLVAASAQYIPRANNLAKGDEEEWLTADEEMHSDNSLVNEKLLSLPNRLRTSEDSFVRRSGNKTKRILHHSRCVPVRLFLPGEYQFQSDSNTINVDRYTEDCLTKSTGLAVKRAVSVCTSGNAPCVVEDLLSCSGEDRDTVVISNCDEDATFARGVADTASDRCQQNAATAESSEYMNSEGNKQMNLVSGDDEVYISSQMLSEAPLPLHDKFEMNVHNGVVVQEVHASNEVETTDNVISRKIIFSALISRMKSLKNRNKISENSDPSDDETRRAIYDANIEGIEGGDSSNEVDQHEEVASVSANASTVCGGVILSVRPSVLSPQQMATTAASTDGKDNGENHSGMWSDSTVEQIKQMDNINFETIQISDDVDFSGWTCLPRYTHMITTERQLDDWIKQYAAEQPADS